MIRTRIGVGLAALLMGCAAGLGGCASPRNAALQPIHQAYQSGDYQRAYYQAALVSNTPTQSYATKQAAAYMAGLSAYRLHNLNAARDYLTFAARSKDA